MPQQALIVEDDPDIAELLRHTLAQASLRSVVQRDGEKGLAEARRRPYDLVLLDVMLPGLDGLEVLKALKRDGKTAGVPVMLVTAKGSETDIVLGLELGAADYVVKPFSPRVLAARAKALLRRSDAGSPDAVLDLVGLRIDPGRHEVTASGKAVALTLTEFKLLHALSRRPGQVLTRNQLLDAARGTDVFVLDRTVDVHLSSLRRKLGRLGDRIETIRGVGYRLEE